MEKKLVLKLKEQNSLQPKEPGQVQNESQEKCRRKKKKKKKLALYENSHSEMMRRVHDLYLWRPIPN